MTDMDATPMHATVLPDFVRRLSALDEAAWGRMAARTPELAGDSAHALLARAATLADGLPPLVPQPLRAAIGFFQAVRAEFRTPVAEPLPRPRLAAGVDRPVQRAMSDAVSDLRQLLRRHQQSHPGVVANIEAIVGSLIHPRLLPLAERERLYAVLEPEIPFGSLIRTHWPPPPSTPPPAPAGDVPHA